jgi:Rad3-related DNA helicase
MWSLYNEEKFLAPLKFSNGKTQEDVTNEILDSIKEGNKVIFVKGMCGTGKSAIALNVAREIGRTSIVVPGKNLQRQYKKDYENKKYVLKDNGEKLKISVITGRKNHVCKFLEDSKTAIPKVEKNSILGDIFDRKRDDVLGLIGKDLSADNRNIPCKIELNEKNWRRIKEYIKQNKDANHEDYESIDDVKRAAVAGACPYWCPVLPEKYEYRKNFPDQKKKNYKGLKDTTFTIYNRKEGCSFYKQFDSYLDSDVIVFNSQKYKLETAMNRKPLTEVEIIDECDEFLDSFSNNRIINIDRLQNALISIVGVSEKAEEEIREISEKVKEIKRNMRIRELAIYEQIVSIKETEIFDLLKIFTKPLELIHEIEEDNYLIDVQETAWIFEDSFNETYVIFEKKEDNIFANIVTTNLAKRFREIVEKNKVFVLMSGTVHSDEVLREIFGLEKFKIIEAETEQLGNLDVIRTGLEFDCKYSNFSSGIASREKYLKALDKCVEEAKKPTIVHVNSFADLPSKEEILKFDLENLISSDELKETQENDKEGKLVEEFKEGERVVLFSTRVSRGVDFPGEQCNSIVFTKYPNPNVKEPFWKILNKIKPTHYWKFYKDKANRELYQKVYRGLRFHGDHIYLLSPDDRVLKEFEK